MTFKIEEAPHRPEIAERWHAGDEQEVRCISFFVFCYQPADYDPSVSPYILSLYTLAVCLGCRVLEVRV